MNSRIIGADTFNLKYDAENRLVEVKKNNAVIAAFTFDADGKRVKSVIDQETILFVGAHFEIKNGNQITKYYMAGSTRIAMRKYTAPQPMTVEYMLSDHLGSTSLTTDANGAKVLELRYKAWGEIRATWTSSPSTTPAYKMPLYQYTGQASYMDDPLTSGVTEGFGLMFYQSRFYDPQLSRFTQADTIIPESTQGTQAWDRYAGMNNNPVRYNDPSGHCVALCIGDILLVAAVGVAVIGYVAIVSNPHFQAAGERLASTIGNALTPPTHLDDKRYNRPSRTVPLPTATNTLSPKLDWQMGKGMYNYCIQHPETCLIGPVSAISIFDTFVRRDPSNGDVQIAPVTPPIPSPTQPTITSNTPSITSTSNSVQTTSSTCPPPYRTCSSDDMSTSPIYSPHLIPPSQIQQADR